MQRGNTGGSDFGSLISKRLRLKQSCRLVRSEIGRVVEANLINPIPASGAKSFTLVSLQKKFDNGMPFNGDKSEIAVFEQFKIPSFSPASGDKSASLLPLDG